MLRPLGILSLLCLALTLPVLAQAPPAIKEGTAKTDRSEADRSQEAFVVEQFSRTLKFENDGMFTRGDSARVRIQSEAGVQAYGVLSFSYASASESFQIRSVRVHKPDGSVVETPPDNAQDMAAEITRQAPFYSDLHEKHLAVKGLGVGDVLEFQVREQTTKPLVPGQFWAEYDFSHDQIVLDEQLEIRVPRDRAVKIKNNAIQPATSEADGYRIYSWHNQNLVHKDEKQEKRRQTQRVWQAARGRLPEPDVLLTSFASWQEVGGWYGGLQEDRIKPTPGLIAKATELTKNAADDEARIRAIYAYVSTQFHYIGISFGIGRYQPHTAAEVLANQYGDCKDKHTLLAALLAAAGIPAYPALISSARELDPDVPTPGQFDHMITAVPRRDGVLWLDATSEVGPYGFLANALRDKHALVLWKDKPAEVVSTPVNLPYASTETFTMEGKLSDEGVLEGRADFSARGDFEYALRAGFRSLALPQWKDLIQRISYGFGFAGDVSETSASSPEKTDEEFHFSYKYTRKDFGDWPNRRILAPMPRINLPAPAEEDELPEDAIWLGSPMDIQFSSRTELPQGYSPQLPAPIHIKEDFAQFDATYEIKDGKLTGQRHLKTLMREVPVGEREKYKHLAKALDDDYGAYIPLLSGEGVPAVAANSMPGGEATAALSNLPGSSNEDALKLESEAQAALGKNNVPGGISALYRAVSADPKFARAWALLGTSLLLNQQTDAGKDAYRKAIAAAPDQPWIPKLFGMSLMWSGQFEDAIPVWENVIKTHPEDAYGPINLGSCLEQLKRYSEAAAQLDAAVKLAPDKPFLLERLAALAVLAGDREKAGAAWKKIAELNPQPDTYNNAAYQMAEADMQLPLALDFSKKAVRGMEEETQKITFEKLTMADVNQIKKLAAYWDTQGWVEMRMSHFEEAEQYLRGAWKLTQSGMVASHLCQLYEREHKIESAIHMCGAAVNRILLSEGLRPDEATSEMADVKKRLDHLTKQAGKATKEFNASDKVVQERMFKMARFLGGTESAEFFLLLSSDGKAKTFKVEDVKFISGSNKLKAHGERLKTVPFNFLMPSDTPARFVRRGILGCYEYSGCSFVLLDPATVSSLK